MLHFIKSHKYKLCLIAILIIAIFFRFYKITQIPPGLYPDEAMNGNNGLEAVATNNFKIFYPENNGREGLFINIQAFSVAFWGNEPWALRIVSGIFGVLTVLGVYLLSKELFRKSQISNFQFLISKQTPNSKLQTPNSATIIALLSSFFLAASFWHTNFSRIGFRAIMLPFLTAFSFYFLFKGFRRGKALDFVWAGIFLGLGFHTYIAFRIVPFVVIAVLILKLIEMIKVSSKSQIISNVDNDIKKDEIREFVLNIVIYAMFALLAALPIFYYFYTHPADFIGRAGQVSIFASQNPIAEIAKSTLLTLGQFNFFGDTNWRHNYASSPLLFWPVGIFFLIGIYACIKKCFYYFSFLFPFLSFPWKRESRPESNLDSLFRGNDNLTFPFLMLWFFAMLAPSILSTEGLPHALRSIGAIPPTFVIAGLGAFVLADFADKRWFFYVNKKLAAIFYVVIILTIGFAGYYKYFIAYANNPNIKGAFANNYVKIGRFINTLPQDTKKYVVVNAGGVDINGLPMPTQTTMFVTNSYRKADQLEKNIIYVLPDELEKVNFYGEKYYVIIPLEKDDSLIERLQTLAPGKLIKENNFDYIIK